MIKKMLVNGDNAGLLAIVGGLAMARNKVTKINYVMKLIISLRYIGFLKYLKLIVLISNFRDYYLK